MSMSILDSMNSKDSFGDKSAKGIQKKIKDLEDSLL
jgi:hypothetical protein